MAEQHEYPAEEFRAGGWEPPPRRNVRRLRVVAAVVVGALLLGGALAWVALLRDARLPSPLPPEVGAARTADAVQLVTGHCLESLPDHGEVARVRLVPCGDEHEAEVLSQYAFRADDVWPGQDAAHGRVANACPLTAPMIEAGVTAVTWAPTSASWERGDRTGLCLAVLPSPSTGSLVNL